MTLEAMISARRYIAANNVSFYSIHVCARRIRIITFKLCKRCDCIICTVQIQLFLDFLFFSEHLDQKATQSVFHKYRPFKNVCIIYIYIHDMCVHCIFSLRFNIPWTTLRVVRALNSLCSDWKKYVLNRLIVRIKYIVKAWVNTKAVKRLSPLWHTAAHIICDIKTTRGWLWRRCEFSVFEQGNLCTDRTLGLYAKYMRVHESEWRFNWVSIDDIYNAAHNQWTAPISDWRSNEVRLNKH